MDEMHDPFEDQVECARYRAERDALAQAMQRVADDIERTFLGFEGADDAPAMRWAREFREALGALHSPRARHEDIEAARWVREHGGLDEVKRHYFATCALIGDLAEWKREVYELCERIGGRHEDCEGEADMLREAYNVLDKRLMPEGMEWPRYEDGEPVLAGNELLDANGEAFRAVSFLFTRDWWSVKGYRGKDFCTISKDTRRELSGMPYSRRVKRPAPKVYDADGVPIHEGDTVWGTTGQRYTVTALCEYEPSIVHVRFEGGAENIGDELISDSPSINSANVDASKLTHTKPEPHDTYAKLYEDVHDGQCGSEEFVRRCKALEGVE